MASRRVNGSRHRDDNDHFPYTNHTQVMMPELGTQMYCCSCGKGPHTDLRRHQTRDCEDYNAHLRLHNGYHRQFNSGQAPPGVIQAYTIYGEHYRMVRDYFSITPAVIMAQHPAWGPYEPLTALPNTHNAPYVGVTYHQCLFLLLGSLPPSCAIVPRPDPRMAALRRVIADPGRRTQFSEYHRADETQDMIAIAEFMEAHPPAVHAIVNDPAYNIGLWSQTSVYRAKNGQPGGLFHPNPQVWLPLSTPGRGIAGQGSTVNGVLGSLVEHRAAHPNTILYHNTTMADTQQGVLNTPGHRRR